MIHLRAYVNSSLSLPLTRLFHHQVYDPTIEDQYRIHRTIDNIPVIVEIHDEAGPEVRQSLSQEHLC